MRKPKPLPTDLSAREFTRAEAVARGVTPQRLKARDITRVGRNVFRSNGAPAGIDERARAVSVANPQRWISHQTAARLDGLLLPGRLAMSEELHLSGPTHLPAARQPGVVGHSVIVRDSEVSFRNGMRISTPGRTWMDLAARLTLVELVVMGDQLLRIPRQAYEDRSEPWSTRAALSDLLLHHPNFQGIVRAREALELMRVGADSAPETKLRLALLDRGLPEPELQIRPDPDDPWSPAADLGYRELKIAIQYDGGTHLTPDQQSRDNRRDEVFNLAGWTYFKFNRDDLANGFAVASAKVYRAIVRAAA